MRHSGPESGPELVLRQSGPESGPETVFRIQDISDETEYCYMNSKLVQI